MPDTARRGTTADCFGAGFGTAFGAGFTGTPDVMLAGGGVGIGTITGNGWVFKTGGLTNGTWTGVVAKIISSTSFKVSYGVALVLLKLGYR